MILEYKNVSGESAVWVNKDVLFQFLLSKCYINLGAEQQQHDELFNRAATLVTILPSSTLFDVLLVGEVAEMAKKKTACIRNVHFNLTKHSRRL